jgi:hypothetical protein
MWRRIVMLAFAALAGTTVGCGDDGRDRLGLRTPPDRTSAQPLPEIARADRRAERDAQLRPTRRDARRVRPVLRGWSAALRSDRNRRAARYFALPTIVAQGQVLTLETPAQVKAFNNALPCGTRLLRVREQGRFLVGTFRLTRRPSHRCDSRGDVIRLAFVLHDRKIAEWRAVPAGAKTPGPERPENAPKLPLPNVS